MQRPGEGVVLGHASHLLCVVVGVVGRLLAPSARVAVSVRRTVRPPAVSGSIPRCSSGPGGRRRGSVGGAPCREYRPVLVSNDNPRIGDGRGCPDQQHAIRQRRRRCRGTLVLPDLSSRRSRAVHSWLGQGQCDPAARSSTCRPDGASNTGMLWHGRHGWAGSPRLGAPIASHLSNAPLRANAANGVTGYDQATLLGSGPCRPS